MRTAWVLTLSLAVLGAGCADAVDDADPTAAPPSAVATTTPGAEPAPVGHTIELRYRVKPRSSKLFQVNLPPQEPGGTMVTWSAFFAGVGSAATPEEPLKAECYVVQSTGMAFEDRILYVADDSSLSAGFDISLSGSGFVDTADGTHLTFECEIDENRPEPVPGLRWETHAQQPIQVTLTPVAAYDRRDLTIK